MPKLSKSDTRRTQANTSAGAAILAGQLSAPWSLLRLLVLTSTLGLIGGLLVAPKPALSLFWGILVPLLPAVFMLTPGLWRNLCPLATSNQLPRLFGWTRNRELPSALRRAVYPLGVSMFFVLVSARKVVFNLSGAATAGLIAGALLAAFVGGLWFKGKSGWCSSICPILPVQRIYAQAPLIAIANDHCKPCVGCAKNCLDVDPNKAHLSDQYDSSRRYRNFRRFFAASFPGFVGWHTFLVPPAAEIGVVMMLAQMFLFAAVSLTVFHLLDATFSMFRNSLPIAFAVLAFNIFYWFSAVTFVQALAGFGLPVADELVVVIRTALAIASCAWLVRADATERSFLRKQREQIKSGQVIAMPVMIETLLANHRELSDKADSKSPAGLPRMSNSPVAPARGTPVVPLPSTTIAVADRPDAAVQATAMSVDAARGQTLLEALEASNLPIAAGCRMGMCGADPVQILDGADSLCAVGDTEAGTLARLGCPDGTRLACMARAVRPQRISVLPARQGASDLPAIAQKIGNPSIRTVLIIGNGVAGITTAEQVRRRHSDCRIVVVSRETHAAYNRMAIARLLNDPAALTGLQLHPHEWYVDNRIEVLLDSGVIAIDAQARRAKLAGGEMIAWDRLIIASGAQGWVPPIIDFDGPGAFMVREADDVNSLRAFLQTRRAPRVVVIGAGLLGIEAAQALLKFGAQVTVISNTAGVLDRQADPIASSMLIRHLKSQGIEVLRSVQVTSIARGKDRRIVAVSTQSGQRIEADAVLGCTGARPELELYKTAGITTRGGVIVDAKMRTNFERVYAVGDVAECGGERPGLWAIAISQAEVAAVNATGGDANYQSIAPITLLKCAGIDLRSFGRLQRGDADEIELIDLQSAGNRYRKLLIAQGRVVGAILINHPDQADRFAQLVRSQADAAPLLAEVKSGAWVVVDATSSGPPAQAKLDNSEPVKQRSAPSSTPNEVSVLTRELSDMSSLMLV